MRSLFFSLLLLASSVTFSQQWQDVGGGVNGIVSVLKADTVNTILYAGGTFVEAGGIPANKIAFWDGNSWNNIGTNSQFKGTGAYVGAITIYNGDLIVGGKFDSIGNLPVHNIARWNGVAWQSLDNGFPEVNSRIYSLQVYSGELYAGGDFILYGPDTIKNIVKWNGNSWQPLLKSLDDYVTSLIVFNNTLIVGGVFAGPYLNDSTQINSPACVAWDGTEWISFGNQYNDLPLSFTVFNDTIYASGYSTLKFYNGLYWEDIPPPNGGPQPWIVDIQGYQNSLYACGYFENPPDLAVYNGLGFDSVCDVSGYLSCLEVFEGELFVGGAFSQINGWAFGSIAKYNPLNIINDYSLSDIDFFPNPINKSYGSTLTIKFNDNALIDFIVEIRTIIGTIVVTDRKSIINSLLKVDVEKLTPGPYFLTLISPYDKKTFQSKFIVLK